MKHSRSKRIWVSLGLLAIIAVGWRLYRLNQELNQEALCDGLWSSAESGENASVIDFLKRGADPNCENGEPLRRALLGEHPDTADILRKAGARPITLPVDTAPQAGH
jgi:hypothetical protein